MPPMTIHTIAVSLLCAVLVYGVGASSPSFADEAPATEKQDMSAHDLANDDVKKWRQKCVELQTVIDELNAQLASEKTKVQRDSQTIEKLHRDLTTQEQLAAKHEQDAKLNRNTIIKLGEENLVLEAELQKVKQSAQTAQNLQIANETLLQEKMALIKEVEQHRNAVGKAETEITKLQAATEYTGKLSELVGAKDMEIRQLQSQLVALRDLSMGKGKVYANLTGVVEKKLETEKLNRQIMTAWHDFSAAARLWFEVYLPASTPPQVLLVGDVPSLHVVNQNIDLMLTITRDLMRTDTSTLEGQQRKDAVEKLQRAQLEGQNVVTLGHELKTLFEKHTAITRQSFDITGDLATLLGDASSANLYVDTLVANLRMTSELAFVQQRLVEVNDQIQNELNQAQKAIVAHASAQNATASAEAKERASLSQQLDSLESRIKSQLDFTESLKARIGKLTSDITLQNNVISELTIDKARIQEQHEAAEIERERLQESLVRLRQFTSAFQQMLVQLYRVNPLDGIDPTSTDAIDYPDIVRQLSQKATQSQTTAVHVDSQANLRRSFDQPINNEYLERLLRARNNKQ